MTATDAPPDTAFASTSDGFGLDSKPAATPPAAPATPATPATPAAPAAPAAAKPADAPTPAKDAKPGDGALLGTPAPVYDLKADTMHADDIKSFADVLGEHKIEAKAGQAILDKMLPALKARAEANVAAAQKDWRAENAKDATAAPRIAAALSVVSAETREALRNEVYVDHPALFRFVAEFGAFVQRATKQDTAVNGASPTPAPKFAPSDTSAAAFAAGVASGF